MKKPVATLIFGWGNPSRGDDALGPIFIERLRASLSPAMLERVEFLTDFQLQVEHALDMVDRERVLFVDAAASCTSPFEISSPQPLRDHSYSTHAMSPASLMQVYRDVQGGEPPPCMQLAIRGERFELGEPMSEVAMSNLERAISWAHCWVTSNFVVEHA